MTASNEKGWFLDLRHTCDEVLALFAREAGCRAARDELTCRCWGKLRARLIRCGPRSGLGPWDLEDAQQQAFFWIQEAIRAFDPVQLFLPRGSSFQTFLNRVFRLRLLDFCRSLRRRATRFRLVGEQSDWPDAFLADGKFDLSGYERELHLQLANAATQLDPDVRVLWNQVRQGKRLQDLPEVLGVTYRTVKRRWRKLREQITQALRLLRDQS